MKKPTYIFRLDDISWDMNARNFARIRDLFVRYGIRPLIGVIPCNRDEKLMAKGGEDRMEPEVFWREVKTLQDTHGWTIALHGLHHTYRTQDGGLFRINPRSEFAGLPYEEQLGMIREGKEILEAHGLKIGAFMAPAHSLDWNTVAALRENGIMVVTDGIAAYPYRKHGVWFIPQIVPWPDERMPDVESVCFHTDNWNDRKFAQFEAFLREKADQCCDFASVIDRAQSGEYGKHMLRNLVWKFRLRLYTRVRAVRYRLSTCGAKLHSGA